MVGVVVVVVVVPVAGATVVTVTAGDVHLWIVRKVIILKPIKLT